MPIWDLPDTLPTLVRARLNAPEAARVSQVDDELNVEWRTQRYDLENERVVYGGGIKATYGPTTVIADELELDTRNRTGYARGNVRVIDPLGVMEGTALTFNWESRTGEATDVRLESLGARLRVGRVEIGSEQWTGYDVWATPCRTRRASLTVESPKVTLKPGRSGRASGVRLSLFGLKTPPLPPLTFSLDRRVEGFRLPAISFRRGKGFGVSWGSGVLLNDRTSLSANYGTFPKSLPTAKLELAWSSVPPTKATGFMSPRSDLGERFQDSYLDRVYIRHQEAEDNDLRAPRRTLAIASAWNQGTAARPQDSGQISKRLEAVAEFGDAVGAWGAVGQVRLESIRPSHGARFSHRAQLSGTLQSAAWPLASDFESRLRIDGFSTLGKPGAYGWLRGLGSISWRPDEDLRLTFGVFGTTEAGNPRFGFDGLAVKSGALLRGDVRYGPVTVNAILKFDARRGRSYSTEWGVSWVMGCFEPFMQSRLVPRDFQFGVRLRIDEFLGKFTQRDVKR